MHFYTDYIKWQIFYGYLPFDILHIIVVLKRFFVASEDELLREIIGIKYNTIYNIKRYSNQLFYHYNRIRDIIAFMTFRYNVGFSGIELLNHNKEFDFLEEVASVCIEQDFELTKKSYLQNICFEDLDDAIPELFRIFYDSENRKPSYSLGFFPENDNKINHMSDSKIREICSGVECELNFVKDIELEENKLLNELVQQVKNTVKIFRKDNPGLGDSVYSFIFGNIKFWTLPAAEKICALFHKYDEEMLILNQSGCRK